MLRNDFTGVGSQTRLAHRTWRLGRHDFGVAKVTEIDYAAARALAEAEILAPGDPADPAPADLIIVDDATLERPYGWVFFYDSRRHKTGAFKDMDVRGRRGAVGFAPLV